MVEGMDRGNQVLTSKRGLSQNGSNSPPDDTGIISSADGADHNAGTSEEGILVACQKLNSSKNCDGSSKNSTECDPDGTEASSSSVFLEMSPPDGSVADGGWGWMCVVGMVLGNMMESMLSRTFGVILVQFRHHFTTTETVLSWIGGINMFLVGALAPFVAALSVRFTVRFVTIVAGLLLSASLIATGFVQNVAICYVTFAFLAGAGQSVARNSGFLIINEYFDKRRGLATGVGNAGLGLCNAFFPPLLTYLFSTYGYQGSFLLMGGIALHLCIGGALMRAAEKLKPNKHKNRGTQNQFANECTQEKAHSNEKYVQFPTKQHYGGNASNTSTGEEKYYDKMIYTNYPPIDVISQNKENKHPSTVMEIASEKTTIEPNQHEQRRFQEDNFKETQDEQITDSNNKPSNMATSTANIKHHPEGKGKHNPATSPYGDSTQRSDIIQTETKASWLRNYPLRGYFVFLVVAFSLGYNLGITSGYQFPLLLESGISESDATLALSMYGVSMIIGNLSGFLFDLPFVRKHRHQFFALTVLLTGAFSTTYPRAQTVSAAIPPMVMYGLAGSFAFGQRSLSLADIVGKERFPKAFGFSQFIFASGILVGRGLTGIIKDKTHLYHWAFYNGGLMPVLTAILYIVIIRMEQNKTASYNVSEQ